MKRNIHGNTRDGPNGTVKFNLLLLAIKVTHPAILAVKYAKYLWNNQT